MHQASGAGRQLASSGASAARRPLAFRFFGFEEREGWTLQAKFWVRDAEGHAFWAYATVDVRGSATDLQASDVEAVGTTARPEVDRLIHEYVEKALIWMRSAAVVGDLDRRYARRLVA